MFAILSKAEQYGLWVLQFYLEWHIPGLTQVQRLQGHDNLSSWRQRNAKEDAKLCKWQRFQLAKTRILEETKLK